jgi:beta-1,4-mannosyl-glycoprotein beta-1,4-N-acetylglucosaminyltransferase|tara:strand:- start:486 stop:1355 length:870 start_codon:yes stop_codon:yes gene_type:complete
MYFDEDLLLDLRLNMLNKYIKKFVIAEATYTHNGTKKKLNFDINNFKKFKDKIDYLVVDSRPNNLLNFVSGEPEHKKGEKLILNGMARDYFQRENLIRGLSDAKEDDIILISDLDEIPNLSNLNLTNISDKIIIFEQKMFYYKLNLLYENYFWYGTKACRKKNLISPQWLRNVKAKKYDKWRLDLLFSKKKYSDIFFVKDGGWHFTYLKTPENLEKKLLNFAHHYEFEKSGLNIGDIRKFMEEKRVVYDHNVDQKSYKWSGKSKLKKIQKKFLPQYINSNLDKYKNWLE